MFPGSLFIDGLDFSNLFGSPFDYYYKALDTNKYSLVNSATTDKKSSITKNDDEFTMRLNGIGDSDYDIYFDGDRTFEVSFERTDGSLTTKKSVKARIPDGYELAHEEFIDGKDMVFKFPKKKQCCDVKCEEAECSCPDNRKEANNNTESLRRTCKWMAEELGEAIEIGDAELVSYLGDTLLGIEELLKRRKCEHKCKCKENELGRKILGKYKNWLLNNKNIANEI